MVVDNEINNDGIKYVNYNLEDEFDKAKIRFYDYLGIVEYPISFSVWNNLSRDKKAVGLYVNFYKQVKVAWLRARQRYKVNRDECDGLSALLYRLDKVVDKIMCIDMYTPAYIYRVCYNALSSVTRALRNQTLKFNNLVCTPYDFNDDYFQYSNASILSKHFDDYFVEYKLDKYYIMNTDEVRAVIDNLMSHSNISKIKLQSKIYIDTIETICEEVI